MKQIIIFIICVFYLVAQTINCWGYGEYTDSWPYSTKQDINAHSHTNFSHTSWVNNKNYGDFDHALAVSAEKSAQKAKLLGIHLLFSDHCVKMTIPEWLELARVAQSYSQQGFAMIRGFEWTPGSTNHINVFNSTDYVAVVDVGAEGIKLITDQSEFLNWLASQPKDVFAQFNHPNFDNRFFDFKQIALHQAANKFCLLEIGSGPSILYTGPDKLEPQYQAALMAGLRVIPSIGNDNPGPPNEEMRTRHTVIWTKDGSATALTEGIINRCGYASEDKDATVKFYLEITDCAGQIRIIPMGKRIFLGDRDVSVKLCCDIEDNTDYGTSKLTYIAVAKDGCKKITQATSSKQHDIYSYQLYDYGINNLNSTICYYAKIKQADGDYIITAPIWIKFESDYFEVKSAQDRLHRRVYEEIDNQSKYSDVVRQLDDYSDDGPRFIRMGAFDSLNEELISTAIDDKKHFFKNHHQLIYLFFNLKVKNGMKPKLAMHCMGVDGKVDIKEYLSCFTYGSKYINKYLHAYIKANVSDLPSGRYNVWIQMVDEGGHLIDLSIWNWYTTRTTFYIH